MHSNDNISQSGREGADEEPSAAAFDKAVMTSVGRRLNQMFQPTLTSKLPDRISVLLDQLERSDGRKD